MATEIGFNEGKDLILTDGMPGTSTFMLVTDPIAADPSDPQAGELYAGTVYVDVTEVDWTGTTHPYARKSDTTPASADGVVTYELALTWLTGDATDGPADARTLILLDDADSTLIYAWDVPTIVGETADMSAASSSLNLNSDGSFDFFLQNVGGN
jgi:hypothetical protein